MGAHRHPALVECFTVLEGEITLKLAAVVSQRSRLGGR
jgi:quercetin dioxygenase-like cupin family protein